MILHNHEPKLDRSTGGGVFRVATPSWMFDETRGCADPGLAEFFFSREQADLRTAVEICCGCPFMWPCRDYAQANDERFGVWGGTVRGRNQRAERARRAAVAA